MSRRDKDSFPWNGKGYRDLEKDLFGIFEKAKQQQIDNKKDSLSFSFFEEIRNEELGQYDIILKLRDITNNYEQELLKALKKDVDIYLFMHKEKEEYSYTIDTIQMTIHKFEEEGLDIPYKKPIKGKLKDVNSRLNLQKEIDLEKLLFPHEFSGIYNLQKMIEDKIQENSIEDSSNPHFKKFNWEFSELEIAELGKALCEMNKPKGATQKDVIEELGKFFNLELDSKTQKDKIYEITQRPSGKNIFLESLSTQLDLWKIKLQEKNKNNK